MEEKTDKEKNQVFYRDLCISFVGSLRALSLYPPEHPETKKKVDNIFNRLSSYLKQRSDLTLLIVSGDLVMENIPLPELSKTLAQFIRNMEAMKVQRIVFKPGLPQDELIFFLQLLLKLMKRPDEALEELDRQRTKISHIMAGPLPTEGGTQISYEELSVSFKAARESVLSISEQVRDLFSDIEGPIPENKVSLAHEITGTIRRLNLNGEVPVKILIYRQSADADHYIHAINVCGLSMALAREIDLDESVILEVGVGALLHDIGLHLPSSDPFSETAVITFDEMRRQLAHPVCGAEILLATPGLPELVPVVAYEHHLHYDGGGYPVLKRHRDLNLASMLICITNSYDNLRRNDPEKKALSLKDAVNWMDLRFGTHFHPLLFKKFRALVKAQAKEEI